MAERKMLTVLGGQTCDVPPIWLMRQAGRYLPEYREIRARYPSFLDLCYAPESACEITLQPIRRFDFDAAILFSDILVVPDALGQDVRFEVGEGPRLQPITTEAHLSTLDLNGALRRLSPVLETVERVRAALAPEKTLLGFCGAPWTVATYMIAGHATPDQAPARMLAYENPGFLERLLDMLVEASAQYLVAQLKAGADAVQIFESWAGPLPEREFHRWVIEPTRALVRRVRAEVPGARIIGFPRAAGLRLEPYLDGVAPDMVALDWTVPLEYAQRIQSRIPIQGTLDPLALLVGGEALDAEVRRILGVLGGGPFVFNLGHGIIKETPIPHVERLVALVRGEA
ncbi:uroporphyrinogen decarboxylase [Lutibaculum baratangense]|uniref:Uroporphyrinogen decarboxylase n=1 Tax=Lutibaculum baratangense AMV1 TaxID=631454 RepID=V4R287_9HYPH|nr:uroporphyrinogen decarboxylase [Lutibaculum baratangense]ESR26057.1 Uroporphyrinogen III decarboxylase [Lutibaculum baratangense AMV1]